MSARSKSTSTSLVQFAHPNLPTAHKRMETTSNKLAARKPEILRWRKSLLHPIVSLTLESCSVQPRQTTLLLLKPLHCPAESTNTGFTAKLTYELCLPYGTATTIVHTTDCFYVTEAGVNLNSSSMLLHKWNSKIKTRKFSHVLDRYERTNSHW